MYSRVKEYPWLFLLGLGSIIIAGVTIGFYSVNFWGATISSDPGNWAELGSFFGGMLSPVFAFLAFLALLYAIGIQKRELRETLAQISLANQLADQQKFETTFFNLLKFISLAEETLEFNSEDSGTVFRGLNAAEEILGLLNAKFFSLISQKKELSAFGYEFKDNEREEFYDKVIEELGHDFFEHTDYYGDGFEKYFSTVDFLLSYIINDSSYDKIDKSKYISILGFQTSDVLKKLLTYYSILNSRLDMIWMAEQNGRRNALFDREVFKIKRISHAKVTGEMMRLIDYKMSFYK